MRSSFEPLPRSARVGSGFEPTVTSAGFRAQASEAAPCEPPAPRPRAAELPEEAPERAREPVAPDPTPLLEAAAALERAARGCRDDLHEQASRWLWGSLDVAVAMAERILARELSLDPAALRPLVESAIELLPGDEPVDVLVAPETIAALEAVRAGDAEGAEPRRAVRLTEERELRPGEARVRSGAASVDLRIETLVAKLREELVPLWEAE